MNYELDCRVKTTPQEIIYRQEHCQDISVVDPNDIQCTACGEQLIAKHGHCFVNRIVGTLQCQICYERCEDKKPWKHSNQLRLCMMCGKSSEDMQKCIKKDCNYSSCQVCILRNKLEIPIETNKRKWNCFICNVIQLYPYRAVAAAVMASLSEKSNDWSKKNLVLSTRKKRRRNMKCYVESSDTESSSDCINNERLEMNYNSTTQSRSRNIVYTKVKRGTMNENNSQYLKQTHNEKMNVNISKNLHERIQSAERQNSSSDKEFSQFKIIPSYVSLQRIPDIEKDYTFSPKSPLSSSSSSSNNLISKQDAFTLKNNVYKFLKNIKTCIKSLQSDVETIEKQFHYKENLKLEDATRMMVACTRMIRNLKDNVNNSEDKVVNFYSTWCKKNKVKNTLINTSRLSHHINTLSRYPKPTENSTVMASSGSDSDVTVKNYATQESDFNKIISPNPSPSYINQRERALSPLNSITDSHTEICNRDSQELDELPLGKIDENLNNNYSNNNTNNNSNSNSNNSNNNNNDNEIEEESKLAKETKEIRCESYDLLSSMAHDQTLHQQSSTPQPFLESNKNCLSSPSSSTDMFEEESETEVVKNIISPIIEKTPDKYSSEEINSINEKNTLNEAKKSPVSKEYRSKSSDSDNSITCKIRKRTKMRIFSDEDEELKNKNSPNESCSSVISSEKPDEKNSEVADRLTEHKQSSSSDTDVSMKSNNITIPLNCDINEEQMKRNLLATSSESEAETIPNHPCSRNSSLIDGDKSSESEDAIRDETPRKNFENHSALSSKSKKKTLNICNNEYYKSDLKLRMNPTVVLPRLNKTILVQYLDALNLSRKYLENKQIKSLISIDNIEKKKNRSNASSNDEELLAKRAEKSMKRDDILADLLEENNKENDNNEQNDDENDRNSLEDFFGDVMNDDEALENFNSATDKLYKTALLESSHSEAEEDNNEKDELNLSEDLGKSNEKKKSRSTTQDESNDSNSDRGDINEVENDKSSWKRSKILTQNFSDTDSEKEEHKAKESVIHKENLSRNKNESGDNDDDGERANFMSTAIRKKRARRCLASDDSDVKSTDNSSVSDVDSMSEKKSKDINETRDKKTRKRPQKSDHSSDSSLSVIDVKKPKAKRKRIRVVTEDSDSDSENENNGSQGNKSGRKNIRKLLKDKQVAEDTKQAGKLEEERLKRMADRQKLYNEMYEARLANEEKVEKLILDFDEESKEVLLSVDKNLVKRLKPHQARGIKFMWDAAFESLARAKTTPGSGCILAHCMGLGKSFQVVTLAHTLLSNSEKTGVNTILIVAPLSTVLNWVHEFKMWLSEVDNGDDIEIYEMTKCKTTYERKYQLESWTKTGGILIMGYEMFRNLTNAAKKIKKSIRESILKCLVDPGADMVICDEGHLLKNVESAISKSMSRIRTLRRVVLTGTPLQNNLIEYHCMVQFVKPNLLGTKKEFSNRFVNPIQNGQFDNSTEYDVKIMKKRAHVLHKMLEGSVQRYDYSVLTPFLPPKQEYVILVRLTDVQAKLYQFYLENFARKQVRFGSTLFADFQALQRIWTHPRVVKLYAERMLEKRREAELDSEGSLKDFIDDDSDSANSSSSSNGNDSDVITLDSSDDQKKTSRRGTRANPTDETEVENEVEHKEEWWNEFVKPEDLDDIRTSAKLLLLFDIIKESEAIGDKVLVFSQSLYSLSLIEKFLSMIDDETQKGNELENLGNHTGSWSLGLDYFRFDGQTSADNRSHWVKSFNRPSNTRARLFLISTRAGGLGINLTAANRVVIFDASWNPSHDVQSIFRIYRFGQKKPCYVYRLLASGTMEEKIYNRQVTKLSLSCRVVDEQQIERHFSNNDLTELYEFEAPNGEPQQLALPKDRLIAEIFLRHKKLVETYHEHDSLLENIAEEELDEEERKQAWLEYEQEKAGKRMMPMQMHPNYQFQQQMMMMQQLNNQTFNNLNMNEMNVQTDFTNLLSFICKDYPHLTEAAQKEMALRAISNMYNYVENQVTTAINVPNRIPNVSNPTATLANALAQQEYARHHSTAKFQQQQQQQMQYAQKFGNNIGFGPPPLVKIGSNLHENDVLEIPSSSTGTTTTLPTSSSAKSQEE